MILSTSAVFISPVNFTPLTKKVGVALTPNFSAARSMAEFKVCGSSGGMASGPPSLSAMRRGQVFGRAYIQRGTAGGYSTNCSLMLVADYITNQVPANWPNGTLKSPCEGPGRLVSVRSVAPAAGLDWSYAVPVDFRFRVQSVSALLTTSAHVSNRTVTAWIKDAAGNIVFQSDGVHTQAAGLAYRYSLVPGVAMASLTSVDQVLPFPHDLILPAGFSIGTETLLLDAADQWSDAWLLVERWFEND